MSKIPTICMIPSGYKAGKVYSVLPANGDADLTFTRVGALPSYNATRVNENGLIEEVLSNVPRLDYSDGGCPSLLVEPQSTNLVTYSEDFSDASWIKGNSTITINAILAPNETLTADKLVEDSTNNAKFLQKTINVVNGSTYTLSCFAKKSERKYLRIIGGANFNGSVNFDLDNGTFQITAGNPTVSVESFSNGWYRCSITNIVSSTSISPQISMTTSSGGTGAYAGDGTSGLYIWGAQLEAKTFATSYIPTVASTVTRVAETVSKTGLSSYINSQEGVLFVEPSAFISSSDIRTISITDGTANNQISLRPSTTITNAWQIIVRKGGIIIVNEAYSVPDIKQFSKIAIKYKLNDYAFFINGVKVGTDLIAETFTSGSLNKIAFDTGVSTGLFFGKVKNLQVFNTALSDAELISLTSN